MRWRVLKRLRVWVRRLMGLVPSERREQELAVEIGSHLQMHIDDNLRAGMSAVEARRSAILSLGGVEMTKQAYREQSTVPFVETVLQDLRFAGRQLRKNPGFTATAVLMLALGMAASVAIFAFVDAALIKPLPYADSARLVEVTETAALFGRANLSYLDYLDWTKSNTVFRSMAVYTGAGYMLPTSAGSELVTGLRVSDGFFKTLGVAPMLGRDFYADEDKPNAPRAVMLSYAAWQKRYAGRKDVIGQAVNLSGVPYSIVGVLPKSFQFVPRNNAEFVVALQATAGCELRRSCHNLIGVGRLKDGVTVQGALAEMTGIAQRLEQAYPDSNRGQGASVIPLSEAFIGDIRPILLTLLGGAGLLLLIACVNVASLLLVRSESRRREIAVRGALGASRGRLSRQFVTEGLLLVAVGSAVGVVSAMGTMRLLMRLLSKEMLVQMPYLDGLGLNLRVLAFACAVALIAAVVFSVTPMLRLSGVNVRKRLAEGSRGAGGSGGAFWRRLGSHLVVVELAIAMVLLVSAGLLGKSFYRLLHVDLGFQPEHLATMTVAMPDLQYAKEEQQVALAKRIVEEVSALPGVKAVATTSVLPVSGNGNTDWIRFVGRPYDGKHIEVNDREVTPGFFTTLGTKLLRGRYFTDDDSASKPKVVIVNQTFAKKYFASEDPMGKVFGDVSLSPKSLREIVEDVREASLDSETWATEYSPYAQGPDTFINLVVRTGQNEASVMPTIVAAIHRIDPAVGTSDEATMTGRMSDSQTAYLHRSSAWLVGGFAALALVLGVTGLYGVIAYSVSQRTREIGVRMALGAQRGTVYGLILREAGWLTGWGIVAGLVCAVGAATLMQSLLFGTAAWDATTLLGVAVVLGVSAMVASYLPARRAASVNPVEALRAE